MSTRSQILETLRQRVHELETDCHSHGGTVPTGCGELDQLVGGFKRGSLVEWISSPGSGATTLALKAAQQACEQRVLVVIDNKEQFYPPAASALGIDLNQIIVIQPRNTKDYHWSLIQILRSTGIAAVMCWPDQANEKMWRRWQLAAEHGKTLGFLVRPVAALREPTWAQIRLLVEPRRSPTRARRWQITALGSLNSSSIELEMDHETGRLQKACTLPMASSLVHTAPLQRSTGA